MAPPRKQAQSNFWKLLTDLFDRFAESDFTQRMRHADLDFLHRQMAVGRRSAHFAEIVEQSPASFQHDLTGASQADGSRASVQQRHTNGRLETLETTCHGRLGHVQLPCRTAERAGLDHGDEGAQIIEFHLRILTMLTIHWQHSWVAPKLAVRSGAGAPEVWLGCVSDRRNQECPRPSNLRDRSSVCGIESHAPAVRGYKHDPAGR